MNNRILWVISAISFLITSAGCRQVASPTFPAKPTATAGPTGSPTQTASATSTGTVTRTFTATPVFSDTSTSTSTATPTHTVGSPSPTYTSTATPSPTQTVGGPTDTPTTTPTFSPTFTQTLTPTATGTPSATSTATSSACPLPALASYPFNTDIGCWGTNNLLGTTTVDWAAAPPAGSTSGGGAFHAHVAYSASTQLSEEIQIPFPPGTDLSGRVVTFKLYLTNAVKGTAWGGGIQPYVHTGSGLVFCYKAWTNLTGFGAWYTYTMDLTSTCGAAVTDVRDFGMQVIVAAGGGTGDLYLDDVAFTAPPTATPTPCTNLLDGFETLSDNGTATAEDAVDNSIAAVDSSTAPAGSITQGTHNLQITTTTNPGWNKLLLVGGLTSNTIWSGSTQVLADVYVSPAVMSGATWNQLILQADSGAKTNQQVTAESYVGIVSGQQTLVWNLDFTKGTILSTDPISNLHLILNGDTKPGAIYIDNLRLGHSCP